jgi:rfaE bifunctional protein kinase chain/domain
LSNFIDILSLPLIKMKFMTANQIKGIFDKFNDKNILIIGDVMIDAYIWGNVDRISPEAPVPVVSLNKEEFRMGGAANVALNIHSLGATPILCAVVGNDENATKFYELLEKRGMPSEGILKDDSRPTTIKTRIISNSQQLIRVDRETTQELTSELEGQFTENVLAILANKKVDAIIFQDYDKGAITSGMVKKVVDKANELKIPTLVDPKKRHFLDFDNVTLFKPNFKELNEGLNLSLRKGDFEQLAKEANVFLREKNYQYILITLSELGVFISDGKNYKIIPTQVRDIADVSGAGDTVISMASLCLAADLDYISTATLSNLAGGLVCEKVGVVPIEKEMILKQFS